MARTKKPRVLICDDKSKKYAKLKEYLEHEGFECDKRVETQEELAEALRKAEEERNWYQFVMIDMDLSRGKDPSTFGSQVYHNLLPDFPNEAYVIYSSEDADQFRNEINRLRYREVEFVLLENLLREKNIRLQLSKIMSAIELNKIFLVHGRDLKKKNKLKTLLEENFGLKVIEWEDARERIAEKRDYIFEIVMKGIEMSHLTIVLFTDDEMVELKNGLKISAERNNPVARRQSRANVYIEAGYALGVRPRQTIFIEWPMKGMFEFMTPSDFSGLHTVRYDDSEGAREMLKRRLEAAKCVMKLSKDWKTSEI